ncbi:NurA domain-containing protein [Caldisphaera lagunensis DSM 15908]|uniref:NurA domain-containing protein n=1 Tax=Caldisphaera lagunensis (strain DSM 15908 / JCM 11604 / ANMR 0165 / IC-154) TaxID=1056495 RepID=L0AAB2_CALLD|nr:DNA double-strand break repair nuclease NurA [Caldisphaera lagunensis]AFZ69980.1 NurA domain-containing protein [Caldisphaera lagunensis DSM 15908]
MEFHKAVKDLISILSEISKERPYLGIEFSNYSEASEIYEVDKIWDCDDFKTFSYLDSSSRVLSVRGANIYISSLYANDNGKHIMIPLQASIPFMAIKGDREVIDKIKSSYLSSFVITENINGFRYDESYKDDNILDELRINLENHVINSSNNIMIVDGPVFPGPYLPMVGEPYRSTYETLILNRKTDNLVGIVKRLNYSRKLSRVRGLWKFNDNATDDVITMYLGKNEIIYVSPIYEEKVELTNKSLKRYMVYCKVRDSVFRVESPDKEMLCKGVKTAINHSSYRGIPTFIESADKLSRKLGASAFLISFIYAKSMIGVNYEDWLNYQRASLEVEE